MASMQSLGVHIPVALPAFIAEGLLPADSDSSHYQWETYVSHDGHSEIEEEVLATKTAVAWSQGRTVRNIYRFEQEGENVVQALLTTFSFSSTSPGSETQYSDRGGHNRHPSGRPLGFPTKSEIAGEAVQFHTTKVAARALVVLLKTKIHIHVLQGSCHIVDLPFEIERAFAAPQGLLLQRRRTSRRSPPPSPTIPRAPPNSFFSSQPQSSLFSTQTSQLSKPSVYSSPAAGSIRLDALFEDLLSSGPRIPDDDIANLYSLSDPLSDLGVVTYSVQLQQPRAAPKKQPSVLIDFESLDPAEHILYVSWENEMKWMTECNTVPLILLVTFNDELNLITLWHAWYMNQKSLHLLLKQHAEQKAAKARRRSSFMSANFVSATGSTTPAVRARDYTRESFLNPTARQLNDTHTSQRVAASSRKSTQQQEEDVMASQMDPDYQPPSSQQPARESRRISSMNTDVRSVSNTINASFGNTASRRAVSYGGQQERRSLGHRRSRGSTPGSIFSRSVGPDDDQMDLDSVTDYDHDETAEGVLRHMRETFNLSTLDNVIGNTDQGFKRELSVRKIHSFHVNTTIHPSPVLDSSRFKVLTFPDARKIGTGLDGHINIYIQNRSSKEVRCIDLQVQRQLLWPELKDSPMVEIPLLYAENIDTQCEDMIKVRDRQAQALVFDGQALLLNTGDVYCAMPKSVPYRVYSNLGQDTASILQDKDIGKNRILPSPVAPLVLSQAGLYGSYDEIDAQGVHHRRRLQLIPESPSVEKLLQMCECLLPDHAAKCIRRNWCMMHARICEQNIDLAATSSDVEFVAFVAAVFTLTIKILDNKARASLNVSKPAWTKTRSSSSVGNSFRKQQQDLKLLHSPAWKWTSNARSVTGSAARPAANLPSPPRYGGKRKDYLLAIAASLADEADLPSQSRVPEGQSFEDHVGMSLKLMLILYTYRQEQKLSILTKGRSDLSIAPVIVQLGKWIAAKGSDWVAELESSLDFEGASDDLWVYVKLARPGNVSKLKQYVGIFDWFEGCLKAASSEEYPLLSSVVALNDIDGDTVRGEGLTAAIASLTPRLVALSNLMISTRGLSASSSDIVEHLAREGLTIDNLQTLPEAISAPFKEAISRCEKEPLTTWSENLLNLVGRSDLVRREDEAFLSASKPSTSPTFVAHDLFTICHLRDQQSASIKTKEASRHAVSQLIFNEDRRLVEATSLMHFSSVQVAECPQQPEWSDVQHLECQKSMVPLVSRRMISLPTGDGMIHFDCQNPLLTDIFKLPGFSSSCRMMPMGNTVTLDLAGLSEEKVNWAYFHAGVATGLSISRNAKGIDTSWLVFNKPPMLTNRHAGFLLALGLSGHLRYLAKWLSFRYLTSKHAITSIGLLLGLSASHIGTMDGLITRMLSVHITQMLPPGAAELNVSPVTQTAGLMGIGLLYFNTQHRRMSEVMLAEIENADLEDPDSGPDPLRDESYRLAAGFALGLINLAQGKNLRGLQGMQLAERLLLMAVGPKPVNAVHVFDTAAPGAVIAIALVYMKSGDTAIAKKIDIPDTEAQFDQVRPDVLLLRTTAKHIILWDSIRAVGLASGNPSWIRGSLPASYKHRFESIRSQIELKRVVDSAHMPFFNITTGLAWSLALKYAGSGDYKARDEVLDILDVFYHFSKGADAFYFDGKVGRASLRRCIDMLAVCAATIMAGTGDLLTFRHLRRLHGRIDEDTNYGSHVAAHMAIGLLFLGGGTYTLATSDFAVAMMMCAIYPIYPTDVHDNAVHLQAFRHFWVFAAEARCIVIEDIDTGRPIHMPLLVAMKDGSKRELRAPCLLPELDSIATVQTQDPAFWRVTLDFAGNPQHLHDFRKSQRIFVRRSPAAEAYTSDFSAALAVLNDSHKASSPNTHQLQELIWRSVFTLPALAHFDRAEMELILPPDMGSSSYLDERGTAVDERLGLAISAAKLAPLKARGRNGELQWPGGLNRDSLWNLRLLFAWADVARRQGGSKFQWLSEELVEALKTKVHELEMTLRGTL